MSAKTVNVHKIEQSSSKKKHKSENYERLNAWLSHPATMKEAYTNLGTAIVLRAIYDWRDLIKRKAWLYQVPVIEKVTFTELRNFFHSDECLIYMAEAANVRDDLIAILENELKNEMEKTTMNIKLDDGAYMPERAHKHDAGLDLRTPVDVTVPARGSAIIDTGVHAQIPKGMVGMLKSRSGLNVKFNITSEGVIDAGYTGSIVAKLYNFGDEDVTFEAGAKITQLVILPVCYPQLRVVKRLKESERGDNGFGSTGV